MKNIFLITVIFIFITNCSIKKVEKHHGVYNLKKKSNKLELLQSNTNDVIEKFGIPSTKSTFDNDTWIYIERKFTSSELSSFGRQKLLANNVLVLEFNNKGLLIKKKILSINEMNDLEISADETQINQTKKSFINTFLTSIRKKINDPLGIKKAK
tara:strand:+ start:52 stop:516 length:465 start_codon:yes stop_codon:yes gene_type:complete